jgi:hypothetical protein
MIHPNVARLRLSSQQILNPSLADPAEVVRTLGAIQAQDYAGSLWSVGLRTPTAMATGIREAIANRQIVRTWLLRGTLHFVAPEDVRWILALAAPRIIAGSAGRHRQLGLSGNDFSRSRQVIADGMSGGRQLTREEMFRLLNERGISTDGQRGYHLLVMAGLEALICFGPNRGRQQTFVLLDDWVPETGRDPGQKEAPGWLAERYFQGHGPATLQDFAWWSGLTVSAAKAGVAAAGSRLSPVTSGGNDYFMAAAADRHPGEPAAYLLPGFDEYILGYRDRSAILDPVVAGRTVIGGNGMMLPTVVIDGIVAGTWKRSIGKQEIAIGVNPLPPLRRGRNEQLLEAAERYGKFMGMPVTVAW